MRWLYKLGWRWTCSGDGQYTDQWVRSQAPNYRQHLHYRMAPPA